jgi:hypothetical protein
MIRFCRISTAFDKLNSKKGKRMSKQNEDSDSGDEYTPPSSKRITKGTTKKSSPSKKRKHDSEDN